MISKKSIQEQARGLEGHQEGFGVGGLAGGGGGGGGRAN